LFERDYVPTLYLVQRKTGAKHTLALVFGVAHQQQRHRPRRKGHDNGAAPAGRASEGTTTAPPPREQQRRRPGGAPHENNNGAAQPTQPLVTAAKHSLNHSKKRPFGEHIGNALRTASEKRPLGEHGR